MSVVDMLTLKLHVSFASLFGVRCTHSFAFSLQSKRAIRIPGKEFHVTRKEDHEGPCENFKVVYKSLYRGADKIRASRDWIGGYDLVKNLV